MLGLKKLSFLANSFKQVRNYYQTSSSIISPKKFNVQNSIAYNIVNKNNTNSLNIDRSSTTNNYICPSIKSFQLPINDFKITDILKRHELNLPEINKNKVIYDPLLVFQVEKELPMVQNEQTNSPMYCGRPLFSERKWRSRKMNIKKRKKYQKKMFYVIQKRNQAKEKRYNNLLKMYSTIHEKKVELFDPNRFINRELEKAKFYGFKCNQIYDEYRSIVNEKMKTFDEKYFRKFDDPRKPLHLKYEEELQNEIKK